MYGHPDAVEHNVRMAIHFFVNFDVSKLLYLSIPANPQSTKTWRQPQKFSKWEPFLLADFFFSDFTFFNAITVHYLRN